MMNYRIVETRPGVFNVEEFRRVVWYLPWIKDWMPVTAVDCPAVPEYSGSPIVEFTRPQAEAYVAHWQSRDQTEYLRRHPPQGYPRIVKTWTVTDGEMR